MSTDIQYELLHSNFLRGRSLPAPCKQTEQSCRKGRWPQSKWDCHPATASRSAFDSRRTCGSSWARAWITFARIAFRPGAHAANFFECRTRSSTELGHWADWKSEGACKPSKFSNSLMLWSKTVGFKVRWPRAPCCTRARVRPSSSMIFSVSGHTVKDGNSTFSSFHSWASCGCSTKNSAFGRLRAASHIHQRFFSQRTESPLTNISSKLERPAKPKRPSSRPRTGLGPPSSRWREADTLRQGGPDSQRATFPEVANSSKYPLKSGSWRLPPWIRSSVITATSWLSRDFQKPSSCPLKTWTTTSLAFWTRLLTCRLKGKHSPLQSALPGICLNNSTGTSGNKARRFCHRSCSGDPSPGAPSITIFITFSFWWCCSTCSISLRPVSTSTVGQPWSITIFSSPSEGWVTVHCWAVQQTRYPKAATLDRGTIGCTLSLVNSVPVATLCFSVTSPWANATDTSRPSLHSFSVLHCRRQWVAPPSNRHDTFSSAWIFLNWQALMEGGGSAWSRRLRSKPATSPIKVSPVEAGVVVDNDGAGSVMVSCLGGSGVVVEVDVDPGPATDDDFKAGSCLLLSFLRLGLEGLEDPPPPAPFPFPPPLPLSGLLVTSLPPIAPCNGVSPAVRTGQSCLRCFVDEHNQQREDWSCSAGCS